MSSNLAHDFEDNPEAERIQEEWEKQHPKQSKATEHV
jgi:cytochrome c oxidase subunit 1